MLETRVRLGLSFFTAANVADSSLASRPIHVALIGNPNTGKSTLFNALAGASARTGNFPGCTVEKKVGATEFEGTAFRFIDLPGTYSLAARSLDEMVAVDVLLGKEKEGDSPDVILCIVDASNIERNFYLLSQILEIGRPTVVALNMVDVAKAKGISWDLAELSRRLPLRFVEVQANQGRGVVELKRALVDAAKAPAKSATESPFPAQFLEEVKRLCEISTKESGKQSKVDGEVPRFLVERLLLDTSGYLASAPAVIETLGNSKAFLEQVEESRKRLKSVGQAVPGIEAVSRYKWIGAILSGVVKKPKERPVTLSDKLDKFLTHQFFGVAVFLILMATMFQAVVWVGEPAASAIDQLVAYSSAKVESVVPEGALRSLLTEGIIAGVGGVVVFLPQILSLFFFIALLEDCGYMARAAFLMDKLMSRIGLSGKSFIPLLSSFACAVPGIMATRVIENRRDRFVTMLVAPLMSCSARLPVYTLLIGAFVPPIYYGPKLFGWQGIIGLQAMVMFAMYAVGALVAIAVAWTLKKTLFRGETPPFVMELPSYKVPGIRIVLWRMLEQGWAFVYRAGTLILAVSVIVWALAYFPHNEAVIPQEIVKRIEALPAEIEKVAGDEKAALEEELASLENTRQGMLLSDSYLGRMGHWVEPAVKPLGWDWRIGCAAIASFPAREVVVATLGVIYNLGGEEDENSTVLSDTLKDAKWPGTERVVITLPVALSIMVFFALCAQCSSTLAVMRRETGSWCWPIFTFVYMTTLAYVGAFLTYQIGTFLSR